MATAVAPPPQWPEEVAKQYEPIRTLGKGGFASVMLARRRSSDPTPPEEQAIPNQPQKQDLRSFQLVAIKVVGSKGATKREHCYAHREVDILKELSHPNIMQVLEFWEAPESKASECAGVMALSYNSGPTVQKLIDHGGALSFLFGRVVIAQLVDALAYCHGRAVIHRDIKPDNVVVEGANLQQAEIWDTEAKTRSSQQRDFEYWKGMCQKWHLTLLDFGFARALSPDDLEEENIIVKRVSKSRKSLRQSGSLDLNGSSSGKRTLNRSISRAFERKMSALGNRAYAAPEIINGVQDIKNTSIHNSTSRGVDITKTLSSHVSNYGMLADAYSLGNTIKHMMTGVSPDQDAGEVIQLQNNPIALLCSCMGSMVSSQASDPSNLDRKVKYRRISELPEELRRLLRGLIRPKPSQRTSVREARRYLFVEEVLDDMSLSDPDPSRPPANLHQIHFLKCTLKPSDRTSVVSTTPDIAIQETNHEKHEITSQ